MLLLGSDVSFALGRNLRLEPVLLNRTPPLGPWLEALILAVACAVPGQLHIARSRAPGLRIVRVPARLRSRPVLAASMAGAVVVAAAALFLPSTYAGADLTHARDATEAALPPVFAPARPRSGPLTIRAHSQVAAGHLVTVYFYSRALHKKSDYLVYVPDQYKASRPSRCSTCCTACRVAHSRSR